MKKLLLIFPLLFLSYAACAQERLNLGHAVNRNSGSEEIIASYQSSLADSVLFTFYCSPDNGRVEYHVSALRNKKAETVSGMFCPQKVVVEAKTVYSIRVDSLNVAIIRKINHGHKRSDH